MKQAAGPPKSLADLGINLDESSSIIENDAGQQRMSVDFDAVDAPARVLGDMGLGESHRKLERAEEKLTEEERLKQKAL